MNIILTILSRIFPAGTSICHKNLAESLVKSILPTWSVNLLRLSELMDTEAKSLSTVRRIQCFLSLKIMSMLMMAMIAYAAAFKDGFVKEERLPIPIQKKTGRKRESILRYGLMDLPPEIWKSETSCKPIVKSSS